MIGNNKAKKLIRGEMLIGILLNEKEQRELESVIKNEITVLDELHNQMSHNHIIQRGLKERMDILHNLLYRIQLNKKMI
jgi:hypothetical protein